MDSAILKNKPVLVTGASGFVGSHVVREMLDNGYTVRVMVRNEGQALAFRSLGVDVAHGDLRDSASLTKATAGVGSILHIAAIFRQAGLPDEVYHDINADHDFNRSLVGMPTEGYGFSNDAPTTIGLPAYNTVRFRVPAGASSMAVLVSPKVLAQQSKWDSPFSRRVSCWR